MDEWEWALTFRLPAPRFKDDIKRFFRELMDAERIQVGYIGCHITLPNHHSHVSAVGFSKKGKSLRHVDAEKWKKRWSEITGFKSNALVIKSIDDPEVWVRYILKNLKSDPGKGEPFFYNNKLLSKFKLHT